jgi:hypothetical protein
MACSYNFLILVSISLHILFSRLSSLNEELLRCFQALDYRSIPQDRAHLVRYGTQEIKQLMTHMEAVFPKNTHLQIPSEYSDLKVYMNNFPKLTMPPV